MKKIIKFLNLFKARFGTFTEEEFNALCAEFSTNLSGFFGNKNQDSRDVLSVFFHYRTPTLSELKIVYTYGDELKWLYLESISQKRKLTAYEQTYMAAFMNFGPVFRFPQQLGEEALERLFGAGDINRIATYVRDFALPERYELELIRRCAQEPCNIQRQFGKCNYRYALELYLSNTMAEKCCSDKVQDELLTVADESLWEKLCATQSMTENVLERNTIRELIAHGYGKALKALLMHSFVPTAELQRYLLASFPALKWELEISKVRHALRKLELETGHYWGVEAPSIEEMHLITSDTESENTEFMVRQRIKSGTATPYFCAWGANKCPQLGEKAYACLRAFAESCKKRYEKKA